MHAYFSQKEAQFTRFITYFTSAHDKVYQVVLMKAKVHRGAHADALTVLMFAPSVIIIRLILISCQFIYISISL